MTSIDKEKARRRKMGISTERKFGMPGCNDCGHHPGVKCQTVPAMYAVKAVDMHLGPRDNDDPCSCAEGCGCGGCGNSNCPCAEQRCFAEPKADVEV